MYKIVQSDFTIGNSYSIYRLSMEHYCSSTCKCHTFFSCTHYSIPFYTYLRKKVYLTLFFLKFSDYDSIVNQFI